jgi:predicted amidohydrolase YtcJ
VVASLSRRSFFGTSAATALLWSPHISLAQPTPADLLLVNAKVETLDPVKPEVSAIAVIGESIVAVGTDSELAGLRGPNTSVVDAGGRRVVPGLNDSHMHFVRGSLSYNLDVRWDGVPSIALAMQKLSEQAARTPPGQWVRVGGGWSEYQFAEGRMPTLDELNRAVPDKPAYVLHFYESSMVNRAGLKALGITKGSKAIAGGRIERDKAGNPTGLFLARPLPGMILFPESKMPALSAADARNSIQQFMRELNRLGMTSVVDPGGVSQPYPDLYGPLTSLAQENLLTLRVAMYLLPPHDGGELQDFEGYFKSVKLHGDNHWFRFAGGGELLLNEGQDWDLYTTPQVVLPRSLERPMEAVVRRLIANKWSFRKHCTFDNSATIYLDVLERVSKTMPLSSVRWAVDHAEMLSPKTIERVAKLGGGIAIQHRAAFHGEYGARNYGSGMLATAPPLNEMLQLGIPVGAGTDGTRDTTYNPWVCIQWLVTGRTAGGRAGRLPPNLVDVRTALKLYTSGSAWFSAEEATKGTLAVGRLADFAVLSQDVFSVPAERLHETESLLTIVGGKPVFGQKEFATLSPRMPDVSPNWAPPAGGRGGYYRRA